MARRASKQTKNTKPAGPSLVVAIGAGEGGLNAIKSFFASLTSPVRSAFIILEAFDTLGPAEAREALARLSGLPCEELTPDSEFQARVIYVLPPGTCLKRKAGGWSAVPAKSGAEEHSLIDQNLMALAKTLTSHLVGVILGGDGAEGVEGLRAVHDHGGLTVAQATESTANASMPAHAIASGIVDHVLKPEDMLEQIQAYACYLERILEHSTLMDLREQIGSALIGICDILQKRTHHDFKHYKTSTLIRRIQRRMQVLQLNSVESYVERLEKERAEVEALFSELLINVTSFFRDPDAFAALDKEVLDVALSNRAANDKFRVWVAGCSSGEEVYTLAILIQERLERLADPPEVQLIATDIDEHVLNLARMGSYGPAIENFISAERLQKYFTRRGGRYHVNKELREICLFSSHNLINDPPFSKLDLISCRNVLIYLGLHLQKKLIPVFHYALKPGGFLFLGNSETLSTHRDLFELISSKHRIAQRKATAIRPISGMVTAPAGGGYAPHFKEAAQSHESDLHLIGQRILLDEFSPKYAIVNEDAKILSVSAGMTQYLDPSEGEFKNNLLKLARPSLRIGLRTTLAEAKKHKRRIEHETSTLKLDRDLHHVGITVQPMPKLGEDSALFMVIFTKLGKVGTVGIGADSGQISVANAALLDQLERELVTTREDLDKTVQDLEASNEELKSSNEELLSMNEELQSANEELEASKEEVQNANEALQRTNTDLENLQASTRIATLFLDDDLRIKSFTPALTEIYRVREEDYGREITDFTTPALNMPHFPDPKYLSAADSAIEDEILLHDGRVFSRRILPYVSHSGKREGLVATFIDVTDLRRSEGRFQLFAQALPVISWTTDVNGEVEYFNPRWVEFTGLSVAESQGGNWIKALHPDDVAGTAKVWRQSVASGAAYRTEYRLRRADGQYVWFEGRGTPYRDIGGRIIQWFGTCIDIDEKRSQVDLLRESGDKLRLIIETVPQFIWRCDPDGGADYASDSFLKWVKRPMDQVLGWKWAELIHPDDQSGVLHEWNRCRALAIPVSIDFRLMVDGQYRWTRTQGNPFFDERGGLIKYYGTWTDIHEQKLARDLLQANEARLETMIRTSPSFMCLLSGDDFRYEQANEAYEKIVGRTKLVGKRITDVIPDFEDGGYLDELKKVRATGQPYVAYERKVMVARKAGGGREWRYVDFVFQPDSRVAGTVERVFVHGNDVTERVLVRNAIENERENFRNLFRQTPEMVCILSGPEHLFEFVNEAHVRALGFNATGMTVREAQPESVEAHGLLDDVYRTGVTAELNEIEITLGHQNRKRYFNLTYSARRDLDGAINGLMILGIEVTHERIGREELLKAKKEAELASEAKTSFLANMSHEIRTPLGAIVGFSDLLKDVAARDPALENYVGRIRRNASQLSRLIDELLDLSKIEANRLEVEKVPVELQTAIEDAFSAVALEAKKKALNFEVKRLSAIPEHVLSDPTRLRQILINLVGNAVKFTHQGRILVELRVLEEKTRSVLEVRVTDSGIGVSDEQKKNLFKPFTQADASITRRYGGTGLGLSLSRELARLLDGDIVLENSELGRGSVFVLTVGLGKVAEVPAGAQTAPAADKLSLKGKKLLIVDDSPDNLTLVGCMVAAYQATFLTAANGAEALQCYVQGDFDAVLMDLQMPVMDGYTAIKRLREVGCKLPVVALTAHALKDERERCLRSGFDAYITKPIDRQILIRTVAELVEAN